MCLIISTISINFLYHRKIQKDFWIQKIKELNIEIAKQQFIADQLSWDINELKTQLSSKQKDYDNTLGIIEDKTQEKEKIENALYYLDKALWRSEPLNSNLWTWNND